jgi:hypothetical protein
LRLAHQRGVDGSRHHDALADKRVIQDDDALGRQHLADLGCQFERQVERTRQTGGAETARIDAAAQRFGLRQWHARQQFSALGFGDCLPGFGFLQPRPCRGQVGRYRTLRI